MVLVKLMLMFFPSMFDDLDQQIDMILNQIHALFISPMDILSAYYMILWKTLLTKWK